MMYLRLQCWGQWRWGWRCGEEGRDGELQGERQGGRGRGRGGQGKSKEEEEGLE